ncbi:MAG TPA: twin-arginine translocase TatA/TatE family subunit [Candidatus Thermoplasmatota archaeon]|nr:twin-arginine translocase TatA/TatE family subunit [Candidatus Thermoplasmatota archaeon]
MPGTQEWLLIILVVILLFGATAIPKLARSFGRAKGEFTKAKREFDSAAARAEHEAAGPSEEQIRRAARELGIEEKGKSLDEVKRLLNERLP